MSFASIEQSKSAGRPVNLFLFRYGSEESAYFAYTDHTKPITYDGLAYGPQTITHEGVVASGGLDNAEVTVNVPNTSALAALFRQYPPGQVINLTIFQRHLSDPDEETLSVWVGRVLGPRRRGNDVGFVCEPISTSIERSGLRRNYQTTCPHLLFGPRCKVVKADFTFLAEVTSFSTSSVTLESGWEGAFPMNKFANGTIEWDTDAGPVVRTILRVIGNTLNISGPTSGLINGVEARVFPGCNHAADCSNLYDNILNFGGFKYIPTENPISRNPYN